MRDRPIDLPVAAIGGPVRTLAEPISVRVWVCLPREGYVQVDGRARAYSPTAGKIEFTDRHGRTGDVWVWAAAIQRR